MPRIRLVHWKATEAQPFIDLLEQAGHQVEYLEKSSSGIYKFIRQTIPDAVVIDLSRIPSHGREIGHAMRNSKTTRFIPILFLNGSADHLKRLKSELPDATYTDAKRLIAAIPKAIANVPAEPVKPLAMMDRYAGRTTAQKLGIRGGSKVAVIDPPRNYASVLGPLPDDVELLEESENAAAVTLWFLHDLEALHSSLRKMSRLAPRTKLWLAWRKKTAGGAPGLTEQTIRESAIGAGMVDYKVCSLDATWSGLAITIKRLTHSE